MVPEIVAVSRNWVVFGCCNLELEPLLCGSVDHSASGVEPLCRPLGCVLSPGFLPASSAPGLGVAIALFCHGVLWGHGVAVWARLELHWRHWRGSLDLDGRGSLGRVGDQQMVRIAAGLSNTLTSRKAVLQIHARRDWPFTGLIENSVGLQFLVAGVHPAVSVGVSCAPELPTFSDRKNLNRVDELLQGEGHIQQNTRFNRAVIRRGVAEVTFGVTFVWYSVRYGASKCHFSTDRGGRSRQYSCHSHVFIVLISLVLIGGEGEIRTPDSLATMSDFESGAFNRALPPLRVLTSFVSRAYLLRFLGSFAPETPELQAKPTSRTGRSVLPSLPAKASRWQCRVCQCRIRVPGCDPGSRSGLW